MNYLENSEVEDDSGESDNDNADDDDSDSDEQLDGVRLKPLLSSSKALTGVLFMYKRRVTVNIYRSRRMMLSNQRHI